MSSIISRRRLIHTGLTAGALLLAAAGGCGDRQRRVQRLERDAKGRGVLRFWNGFTGPDGKTMERIIARFRQDNPDLDVRMQIIPWGTYYDKLTLALAYGGAPDVFVVHAGRLPEFASFGVVRPLDDLYSAAKNQIGEDLFAPVPWQATFYRDKQYAMALDVHPIGLYYNTALFEEAGIVDARGKAKPPTTEEEFLAAAKALTKDTDKDGLTDQWGFVLTWQRTNYMTLIGQFGGALLTENLDRAAMSTPAGIAAISWMRDLIVKHKVAPRPEGIDAWLTFRQGKAAMAFEGIYMLSSLEEQKGLAYAGAPIPRLGEKRSVWGGSHLLAQPAAASNEAAEAGWRLMRYLSDHSLEWAKGGQVPARNDIRRSPEFAALPVQAAFGSQIDDVQYEPLSPRTNALFQFVDPAIEAVLLNLQPAGVAMRDADRRIDQVLQRP